jgi:type I restriction enzyme M protein
LCKLVDEIIKDPEDELDIYIKEGETEPELLERIQSFFKLNVVKKYPDVMGDNEQLTLNEDLLFIIIKELEEISLLESSKDILSDAFEIFVSKMLKEEGGQFITPPNIAKFMVNYLNPEIESKVLDPACGHGGFLLETKELLWSKLDNEQKKVEIISNLFGIDKDLFLARICKLYLEILSSGKSNVFCEDSLDFLSYRDQSKKIIKNNMFDLILTNPPFGAKIPITNKKLLNEYEFGHNWKNNGGKWQKQEKIVKQQPPQILFIERCVQLLKDGGKLGIVLPEGIFGNPSDGYIWDFLKSNGKILGIISLDQNTFQPYTCNKTSILFFQKLKDIPDGYKIDFAIVDNVGHDKDGKTQYILNNDGTKKLDKDNNFILNDDLIDLHMKLKNTADFNYQKEQKLFKINFSQIKNNIFIPSYYIGVEKPLKALESDDNFQLISIGDLINREIIYTKNRDFLPRGVEIGSSVYGLGSIPFIRTSEINNWDINLDSHKKTSEEVYNQFKTKQNIEIGDILLVKDGGPNLIGKTAYITELDTRIIIQSHIFQIKILENMENIDSYLILHLLSLDIVQKQIRAITFVQGTIATIGNRILDVKLPLPTDLPKRIKISNYIKEIIENKTEIRKKIYNLSLDSFDD